MKKVLCAILAGIVFCGVMVGCSSPDSSYSESSQVMSESESSKQDLDGTSELDEEIHSEVTDDEFSASIKSVYDKIVRIPSQNFPDIEIGVLQTDSFGNPEFSIENISEEDSEDAITVSFNSSKFDSSDTSISVLFDIDEQKQLIKDCISLLIQAFEPDLSSKEVKAKLQDFVNTYSSDNFSSPMECGDYIFLLSPGDNGSFGQKFYAAYKPCLWDTIDESEYSAVDFASYKASEMNSGSKVLLQGSVKEFSIDKPKTVAPFARLTMQGSDGHEYLVVYDYEFTPVTFSVDSTVTIYGTIGTSNDDAVIFADKITN